MQGYKHSGSSSDQHTIDKIYQTSSLTVKRSCLVTAGLLLVLFYIQELPWQQFKQ